MLGSLARRLLFVHSAEPAATGTVEHRTILTAFVRAEPGRRRSARAVADGLAALAIDHHLVWRVARVRVLHGALPLVAIALRLTRRRLVSRTLCRLAGVSPPGPVETLPLLPQTHAAVEIVLDALPTADQLDAIVGHCTEAVWVLADRQVRVFDEHGDDARTIVTCFLVHRPPTMTRRECQTYWEHRHAGLVVGINRALRLTQYLQLHAADPTPPGLADEYDGIVYAHPRSSVAAALQLVRFSALRANNTLVVDETHFTWGTPAFLLRPATRWER